MTPTPDRPTADDFAAGRRTSDSIQEVADAAARSCFALRMHLASCDVTFSPQGAGQTPESLPAPTSNQFYECDFFATDGGAP